MNDIYIHGEVNRQNLTTTTTQNFEKVDVDQAVISSPATEANLSLKENELNFLNKQTSKIIINTNELSDTNDLKQNLNRITNDLTNFNNYVSESDNKIDGQVEFEEQENDISISNELLIDKFFERINQENNEYDSFNNCFFCIHCRLEFKSNTDFLQHSKSGHANFQLDKDEENFLTNNLVIFNKATIKVDSKIIVFLIETEMKQKFLEKYSHDLLVSNEETAVCLEQLNRDKIKRKKLGNFEDDGFECSDESDEDDDDDKNEINLFSSEFSLLFVDYSIIQFNRIVEKLKNLYSTKKIPLEEDSDSDNNPNTTETAIKNHEDSESSLSSYEEESKSIENNKELDNKNLTNLENNLNLLRRSKSLLDTFNKSLVNNSITPTQKPASIAPTVHSRNACKKLKCPKCNWHYKYRETLDIHMREKHSTDLSRDLSQKCIYCLENSQHPRLNRGEQYKCGYKPYRCDICDYSTTTKGNLSIHMQSDKHINNLKEIKINQKSPDEQQSLDQPQLELHLPSTELNTKSLELEQNSNMNDNHFKCNVCNNFETDNKKNMRLHKQMVHGISNGSIPNGQFSYNKNNIKSEYNSDSSSKKSSHNIEINGELMNGKSDLIISIFLCPLCQTDCIDQVSLKLHLKDSHSVINEDALKILVKSAQNISKKEESSNETTEKSIEKISIKSEKVFSPLSLEQTKKLDEFINSRFSTSQNAKLTGDKSNNNNNNTNMPKSRSRSTSSTDSDDLQNQLDQFVSSKSHKSSRSLRNLFSQICQKYIENDKFIEIDSDNDTDELIRCYPCKQQKIFNTLSELKSHLESDHELLLNQHEISELIENYVRTILSEFSKDLEEENIVKSIANFTYNFELRLSNKKLPFSAENLLASTPKKNNGSDQSDFLKNLPGNLNGMQNNALLNYLSTFGKNGSQNGSAAPNSAIINQFLLPLMFQNSQSSQKTKTTPINESLNDSPMVQPQQPQQQQQDDDDDEQQSQQFQFQNSDMNNSRRRRTRITEEQLKVLRQYFDINKSPSDEQITDIAQKTQLQAKVIKHWFRNTLFKERQKDKDSPYNFNNPPVTQLNLEEYEKTGKICTSNNEQQQFIASQGKVNGLSDIKNEMLYESVVKAAAAAVEAVQASLVSKSTADKVNIDQFINSEKLDTNELGQRSSDKTVSFSSQSTISSTSSASSINDENYEEPDEELKLTDHQKLQAQQHQRLNRTKFSNIQIRALNQLFKQQRYPKDEQVAQLGKQLHLKPRVITVWFQNARQKIRKSNANNLSNKSQSPSKSSQDYDSHEYDDLEENNYDQDYQDDEDNNNYYETNDTDFDDNQSHLSSESLRSGEKSEEPTKDETHHQVTPNAKALQLAMSFIAAQQANGGVMGKEQSFAALAAAFNSSITNGNNNVDESGNKQDEEDEEENTTGYDDNEISDDEENENDQEEYQSSSSYQMPHSSYQNSSMVNSSMATNSSNNAKRLRTTILPEQQEYLMQKYQLDQNPSRKMLDEIAREVRLKKRVVQVWFQNTRARERKGIIKINNNPMASSGSIMSSASSTSSSISTTSSSINIQKSAVATSANSQFCKRCLFCSNNLTSYSSNVFINRSSLESHLILKHNYTSEQTSLIDIDQFPDVDSPQDIKLHKQMRLNSASPNVSPLPPPPPPASNLQNFYSNLLLQQQQQQQQQFAPNALLHNALLQSGNNNGNQQSNGINTLLMSQLFNQLQQNQTKSSTEENPLDLSSQLSSNSTGPNNNLNALSSIALAAAAAYKTSNFPSSQQKGDRNNSISSNSDQLSKNKTISLSPTLGKQTSSSSGAQQQQQQRRVRTQMTQYQVNVMRLIFAEYKTPTMNECELMGREINLKKRVVQVWFQNARAKEKKTHPLNIKSILFSNTANNDLSHYEFSSDECLLCNVKYANPHTTIPSGSNSQAQRDHLFSKAHITKLIQFVTNVAIENGADLNTGKFFTGFHTAGANGSELKRKQEFDEDENDNESSDDDANSADNEENIIEYGDSEEQQSDNDDSNEYSKHKTPKSGKSQTKNSNDSSFSSMSSVAQSNNSNHDVKDRCFNDENDENNGSSMNKPQLQNNPFDLNRLIQLNSARNNKPHPTSELTSVNGTLQQQQQQNLYNYLLYSNLLNNGKI